MTHWPGHGAHLLWCHRDDWLSHCMHKRFSLGTIVTSSHCLSQSFKSHISKHPPVSTSFVKRNRFGFVVFVSFRNVDVICFCCFVGVVAVIWSILEWTPESTWIFIRISKYFISRFRVFYSRHFIAQMQNDKLRFWNAWKLSGIFGKEVGKGGISLWVNWRLRFYQSFGPFSRPILTTLANRCQHQNIVILRSTTKNLRKN